jgi:hypothetical protein
MYCLQGPYLAVGLNVATHVPFIGPYCVHSRVSPIGTTAIIVPITTAMGHMQLVLWYAIKLRDGVTMAAHRRTIPADDLWEGIEACHQRTQ